jgi:hypothetical protein
MSDPWDRIEAEARTAFRGKFAVPPYSEYMPPPYIGIKPYMPARTRNDATQGISDPRVLDIDEYEQAQDLEPGFDRIAAHLIAELGKLHRGAPHALSHTLLADNPAWPAELAAKAGKLAHDPLLVICPLALSRSQDDKGMARWTLFGTSHRGAACWDMFTEDAMAELVTWAGGDPHWCTFDGPYRPIGNRALPKTLVTFTPFARLPEHVKTAYLTGALTLVPSPASLVLFEHPGYGKLAAQLPRATQIPILHLFPRIEGSCSIRIPQSGWLDENDADGGGGHNVKNHLERRHRWQRIARDAGLGADAYHDKVSVALFATDPVSIDLYDKPLARNSQVWREDYTALLDGPRADHDSIRRAANAVDVGGRFGYRMYYPPMRAGAREVFWHYPLVACAAHGRYTTGPIGIVTAERDSDVIELAPKLLAREEHVSAARLFTIDPGHMRHTTCNNARKILEAHELLGEPLAPSHARALVRMSKQDSLEDWLSGLPKAASSHATGARLQKVLQTIIGEEREAGAPLVLGAMGSRAFEEQIWNTISHLAHGEFRQKNASDGIAVNRGRHGGPAAKKAGIHVHEKRDLEALGDHLHARYRELIAQHGLGEVVDHVFQWESDHVFPWMDGWVKNQDEPAERNIVMMIPGRDRSQAVIMGDHYDTAYMEDVYWEEKGGDGLRAPAAGADDNHSATTALLLAAEHLLPLAKAGKLERDVWLIHLTGEEYPADCMGARAIGQALVERTLAFTAEDGSRRDVSNVEVVAAFILDMIGHNTERDRDVFQIAPGEGAGSARLARIAHRANLRWNAACATWNKERPGLGRAKRMKDDRTPPPLFAHLPISGEIRVEWEPKSALYNTDGQIFSDLGVPVVLFMENYDISRSGYHDTHDTMENIDLDYCAAVTAIAIETVAETACAPRI